jgi:hypothetical protein
MKPSTQTALLLCLCLALPGCGTLRTIDQALWSTPAGEPLSPALSPPAVAKGGAGVPLWAEISAIILTLLGFGWGGVAVRAVGREVSLLRKANQTPPPSG